MTDQHTSRKPETRNPDPAPTISTVHEPEPDYYRPVLEIPPAAHERMFQRMRTLYGKARAEAWMPELERVLKVYYAHKPPALIEKEKRFVPGDRFTEKDMILITYGDLVQNDHEPPMKTLTRLIEENAEAINTIHVLPFFPYSSDRGFSVIDFETVDPRLGTWEDFENLDDRYHLMFDGVFNHVSSKSRWFQEFLDGNPLFQDVFISYRSKEELTPEQLSRITRPRTSDILTRFQTVNGPAYVWTTFSPDQIDLNFQNPLVLKKIVELLLLYVRRGADMIRLDAVTYLWSEPGTSCASLEETHEIVKLLRDILDLAAPYVALVTETNVPHEENVSYFGNGRDEAHMVYNFALPPLVLHTFYTGDSTVLTKWAGGLEKPSDTTHFFHFLDSHDGVGVMGARGILSEDEIQAMVERARQHGGLVSYKTARDGSEVPYEINITWFSALNRDDAGETMDFQIQRMVASRNIQLILQGVPGVYLLGLIGKRNDTEAVAASGSKRAINRTVLDSKLLEEAIHDPESKIFRIGQTFVHGRIRSNHRAFHPNGPQKVLSLDPRVFAVLRTSPEGDERVLALVNVTSGPFGLAVPLRVHGLPEADSWRDLITGKVWGTDGGTLPLTLDPYDVLWLQAED